MQVADAKTRPVWFVYSGMGSQWAGMGKGLLRLPVFAETIARLQPILEPEGINLTNTLIIEDSSHFDNIIHAFIGIAAIQVSTSMPWPSCSAIPTILLNIFFLKRKN